MWVFLIKTILPVAMGLVAKLLGIGGTPDPAAAERAAGEKLGQQETENTNANKSLDEVRAAAGARADIGAQLDADPGSLRKPGDDFATRGKDGIS